MKKIIPNIRGILQLSLSLTFLLSGCSLPDRFPPGNNIPGPDKQFAGMAGGALSGAGTGAITGFQIASATGPGALVGAGIGAISGAFEGSATDLSEEQQLALQNKINKARAAAYAQQILADHYKRRSELHPTRDIFPADLFFFGDEVKLKAEGKWLVSELARINKSRLPYSRLAIAVYSKSIDKNSTFANHLSERRAREIVDAFVKAGLEPRRLSTRPVVISEPVLIDPYDKPGRYNQAVELIPIDR